jgi:hypothetical protein
MTHARSNPSLVPGLLLAVATALLCGAAAAGEVIRLSEPVTVTDEYEEFGAPLAVGGDVMTLSNLVDAGERLLGKPVLVRTEVVKVCQKKGCFFIARDGDATARVTFKDYEFFVPTDSGGKQVTLAGTFDRKVLSDEQRAHLAEDLGEPGTLPDPFEYHIVATSVRIPRS